jgi:hypothetical protein
MSVIFSIMHYSRLLVYHSRASCDKESATRALLDKVPLVINSYYRFLNLSEEILLHTENSLEGLNYRLR